jgi:hypothetical protein
MPPLHHFSRTDIDGYEAVGSLVSRRALRLDTRRHPGRAAGDYIKTFAIRREMQTARPLANRDGRHDGIRLTIDDREIT